MKKIIKKSRNGLIGLFTIKLLLFVLFVFIQSCSDDLEPENQFDTEAIENYQSFIEDGILRYSNGSSANLEQDQLTETEAKILLSEFTNESIIFLEGIGFDRETIDSELGGVNSPNTAAIAYILLNEIQKDQYTSANFDFSKLMFNQGYAEGEILECIGEAFGFAAVGYILQYGIEEAIEHYGKKGLIKVLGKAAGRTLGWIGLAIAAYEFADCMATEMD